MFGFVRKAQCAVFWRLCRPLLRQCFSRLCDVAQRRSNRGQRPVGGATALVSIYILLSSMISAAIAIFRFMMSIPNYTGRLPRLIDWISWPTVVDFWFAASHRITAPRSNRNRFGQINAIGVGITTCASDHLSEDKFGQGAEGYGATRQRPAPDYAQPIA